MKKLLAVVAVCLLAAGAAIVFWPRSAPPEASAQPAGAGSAPARDFTPIEVTAKDEGLTLTGVVKDPRGAPVPNAEVFLAASSQASLSTVRCTECGELLLSCPARETGLEVQALLARGEGTLVAGATART